MGKALKLNKQALERIVPPTHAMSGKSRVMPLDDDLGPLAEDSRGKLIIYLASTIIPFTAVVVFLRFYTRRYVINSTIGLDDWMILVALVSNLPTRPAWCFSY